MDPIIGGALIKGVGGLLGGLFGKKNKAPSPGQNIMSHMQGIREGAEKYGFNPLAWAGTGAVTAPEPTNYMGAAIADAIGGVADAWSNKAFNNAQLDQLEMENEKMRRELNAATTRPDVPGLYARTSFAPAVDRMGGGMSHGISDMANPAVPGGVAGPAGMALRPEWGEVYETGPGDLPTVVEGSSPERSTEIAPVQNQPWFKEVDFFGQTYKVWNDEASDNELAATGVMLTWPFQGIANNADKFRDRFGNAITKEEPTWGEMEKALQGRLGVEWWKDQFPK